MNAHETARYASLLRRAVTVAAVDENALDAMFGMLAQRHPDEFEAVLRLVEGRIERHLTGKGATDDGDDQEDTR